MLKDDARIKGIVNLVLRDQHGRVKQHKTIRNAVTDYGIAHIIGRMIDTGQDRRGLDISKTHIIPRMMSHMAIGVGDPAQTTANTSTVIAATGTNRFLQGEVGARVQVMKDTSRTADYPSFQISLPTTFFQNDGVTSVTTATAGDTFFKMVSGTGSGSSETLRAGMSVDPAGTLSTVFPTGTEIGTIVNDATTGVVTVNLVNASTGNPVALLAGLSATTSVDFQYTNIITSSGHPFASTYNPAGLSEADYSSRERGQIGGYYDTQTTVNSAADNAQLAPFFGEFADRPNSNFEQFGTDVDGVFQGTRVLSSIVEDAGTETEGYRTDENDWNVQSSPSASLSPGQAPDAQRGKKKMGDRIIFIATFKEQNPNVSGNTLVREAGIFNSPEAHTSFDTSSTYTTALDGADAGYTAANIDGPQIAAAGGGNLNLWKAGSPRAGVIDQTMLCRTTFDVVTKAPLDTLQITWSVQLSDQT